MRVLIYSLGLPPFRRGGLVNYTVDLANQLVSNGNTVDFLYPGAIPIFSSNKVKFRKRNTNYKFNCYELINPLPVSLTFGNSINAGPFYEHRDKNKIYKFITKLSPDVVHIHTLMGLPIEFLEVLKDKGIKIVYTTHDYYGLCPKMLSTNPIKKLKLATCSYDCMLCNAGPSITKIKLMQSHLYQRLKNSFIIRLVRNNQRKSIASRKQYYTFNLEEARKRYLLRKYYLKMFSFVDCFHFNSTVAESVYKQYFPKAKGRVVPLVVNGLKQNTSIRRNGSNVVIGFLEGVDEKKGYEQLKEVVCRLNSNKKYKFKLLCAGSDSKDVFFQNINVSNLGILSKERINQFYKRINLLIVPSLCHETFGLVVLEAASRNIPVICSKNVGAKDILPKHCIFSDENELFLKLERFINSLDTRNKLFKEFKKLYFNVDFSKHVQKIQNTFY